MRRGETTPRNIGRWAALCGTLGWGAALLILLGTAVALAQPTPTPPPGAASAPVAPGLTPPPAAPTTFAMVGAPPGSEVMIDGKALGVTPLAPRTQVTPGAHQIKVTRRGFTSYTRDFTAYAGRMILIEVDLVPVAMLVRVRASVEGSQVFVDEELRGDAPLELELRPGTHQVVVRRTNFQDQSWTLTAVAGEELEHDFQLELQPEQRRKERAAQPQERRFYTRWWVWTLAAVGAVGIASAIIIPTVLGQRSDCDKLGGEVCFPIQLGTTTPALSIRF